MISNRKRPMTPEALELVAARFKALSEPIRLRILQVLEEGEMSVSKLALTVGATQPNISKHLKTLHDVGLVARRQEGSTIFYYIADKTVFELCELVCSSLHERLTAQASVFQS